MQVRSIPAYVQAPRSGTINKIIVHDPGQPLDPKTQIPEAVSAVGVANFNATPPAQRNPQGTGGYHVTQDATTTCNCAPDDHRVDGASWANEDGLHICFCDYSREALAAGAQIVRHWCDTYGIPKQFMTTSQFPGHGLFLHRNVEEANHVQGGHTDARNFPTAVFIQLVNGSLVVPVKGNPLTTIATGQKPANGRDASARPIPALGVVLLENGAHLPGDKPSGKNRTWRDKAVPAHAVLIDIMDHRPAGERAISALYDLGDGSVAPYKVEIPA